jgi:hypothetical protein
MQQNIQKMNKPGNHNWLLTLPAHYSTNQEPRNECHKALHHQLKINKQRQQEVLHLFPTIVKGHHFTMLKDVIRDDSLVLKGTNDHCQAARKKERMKQGWGQR